MQTSKGTSRRKPSTCPVPETNSRSQASSTPKPCPGMRRPTPSTRGRPIVAVRQKVKRENPYCIREESRHCKQVLKRWRHSPRNLPGCAGEAACWWQRGPCIPIWDIGSIEGSSPALPSFRGMQCLQCLPRAYHLRIAWLSRKLISWCQHVLRSLTSTRLQRGRPWIRLWQDSYLSRTTKNRCSGPQKPWRTLTHSPVHPKWKCSLIRAWRWAEKTERRRRR